MNKKKVTIIAILIIILILIIGLVLFFLNKKYIVEFDTKCDITIENQTVKRGQTADEPEEPTRDGYIFLGWYTNEESNDKFDFNTKITENLLLVAKWKEIEDSQVLSIVAEKNEMSINEELQLTIKSEPEESNSEEVETTWISSDESIATVDENGTVKAIKSGTVTITATVGENIATFEITVKEEKESNETNTTNSTNTNTSKTSSSKKTSNTNTNTSNTNTNTDTSSTNTNSNVNTDTNNNTGTDTDEDITPEPEITYSYEWVKIDTSVAGQYYLYIVSSEGEHVSGTATITTLAGKSETVSIPSSGKIYVKDAIKSVSNIKVN